MTKLRLTPQQKRTLVLVRYFGPLIVSVVAGERMFWLMSGAHVSQRVCRNLLRKNLLVGQGDCTTDDLNDSQTFTVCKGEKMGLLGAMFGKKIGAAKANLKKIENKDLMEAIVASCILIAYADGECEESELKSMEGLISSNEQLKDFGSDLTTTINKYHGIMQAGPRVGKMKLMREIEDIRGDAQQKEEVFLTAVTIAEADGQIEDKEMVVLKELGGKLGISLKDYGLA